MRPSRCMLILGALALPGCPSSEPKAGNPATLWLAPLGDEKHVQLVDTEPPMF